MKKIVAYFLGLVLAIQLLPWIGMSGRTVEAAPQAVAYQRELDPVQEKNQSQKASEDTASKETLSNKKPAAQKEHITIRVYDTAQKRIIPMDLEDYVYGVVAAEMPSSFEVEALRAQALAARTYTLAKSVAFGGTGCTKHPGADICTDAAHCQAYRSPDKITRDRAKLRSAVDDTAGEVIVSENHLIRAVFHSTSGGRTENSEDVWSSALSYLRSVDSQYEDEAPKKESTVTITAGDFIQRMKAANRTVVLQKSKLPAQIKILRRSEGGSVMDISIGGVSFQGTQIRSIFGLNSVNFTIAADSKNVTFHVKGYGHGIGMSQYGANGMAKHGATYEDIIKHYYQGVEIVQISDLS